jgi:hypothetical protein
MLTVGLIALALNHLSVVFEHEKWFTLVLGGSLITAIGLAGCLYPPLLAGKRAGVRLPLWANILAGVLMLGGIGFDSFLWLVVYR